MVSRSTPRVQLQGRVVWGVLDKAFTDLQQPFAHFKAQGRKNFLNYNYVFCRLFQRLGCTQFCMFRSSR